MSRIFRTALYVFLVATVILAIAIAYVFGEMRGVISQQWIIKELMEKQNGLIVDFGLYVHPFYYPLLNVAFLFGVCWIIIIVITLMEKRKEQT